MKEREVEGQVPGAISNQDGVSQQLVAKSFFTLLSEKRSLHPIWVS